MTFIEFIIFLLVLRFMWWQVTTERDNHPDVKEARRNLDLMEKASKAREERERNERNKPNT